MKLVKVFEIFVDKSYIKFKNRCTPCFNFQRVWKYYFEEDEKNSNKLVILSMFLVPWKVYEPVRFFLM